LKPYIVGIFDMNPLTNPILELIEISKRQARSSILSPLAKATTSMGNIELRFRANDADAGKHIWATGNMGI
jgi:hypothetical protein